ncbi:MAG: histidine kinase [Candidatus Limiplasma sp.]|nr:histidine kinase [Candidatus Limiplasma sp.]
MRDKRIFKPLIWLTLALAGALLLCSVLAPGARMPNSTTGERLGLTGEYWTDGAAQSAPLSHSLDWDAIPGRELVVQGHFDRDILPNTQLVFRLTNLQLELKVNGLPVFSYGDTKPAFMHSAGNVWTAFTSEGIRMTDTVELRLTRAFGSESLSSYRDFFKNLYAGSEFPVYREALHTAGWQLAIGILILAAGVTMLGLSQYARALGLARGDDAVNLSAFVIGCGLWTIVDYRYISLLIPYPAFNQTLEMACMLLMPVFLLRYLLSWLTDACRRLGMLLLYLNLAAALTGLVLQGVGVVDLTAMTPWYALADIGMALLLTPCLIRSLRGEQARAMRASLPALLVLFVGVLLNVLNFFLEWRTGGLFFSLAFLLFAVLELLRLIRGLAESVRRNHAYARMENELTQSRIAVMLSQIKPHFLYNALNAISALCLTDPVMADQAITSLSNYLRGNIRSLEQNTPVPFAQELEHIQYYVRLEQLRYGDKLRVVYAIGTTDFQVPTLSLQTLVENAIRHGVSPKPEGGLVVIQTEKGEGRTVVRIIDNGVGFNPDMHSANADSIGLANAKKRMEAMMGAELRVESKVGTGTTITILIPDPPRKG